MAMKTRSAVSRKISTMVREGYRQPVAVAAALNMERRGKLGPEGGYRRVHQKRRGPVGRMRKT